jgi:hypothetical protein
VSGDVKVNDLAPGMAYNDKDEQHTKPDRGHNQEVYRHHFGHVIFDKRLPSLRRWLWITAGEKSGYTPFGYLDSEH